MDKVNQLLKDEKLKGLYAVYKLSNDYDRHLFCHILYETDEIIYDENTLIAPLKWVYRGTAFSGTCKEILDIINVSYDELNNSISSDGDFHLKNKCIFNSSHSLLIDRNFIKESHSQEIVINDEMCLWCVCNAQNSQEDCSNSNDITIIILDKYFE